MLQRVISAYLVFLRVSVESAKNNLTLSFFGVVRNYVLCSYAVQVIYESQLYSSMLSVFFCAKLYFVFCRDPHEIKKHEEKPSPCSLIKTTLLPIQLLFLRFCLY